MSKRKHYLRLVIKVTLGLQKKECQFTAILLSFGLTPPISGDVTSIARQYFSRTEVSRSADIREISPLSKFLLHSPFSTTNCGWDPHKLHLIYIEPGHWTDRASWEHKSCLAWLNPPSLPQAANSQHTKSLSSCFDGNQ